MNNRERDLMIEQNQNLKESKLYRKTLEEKGSKYQEAYKKLMQNTFLESRQNDDNLCVGGKPVSYIDIVNMAKKDMHLNTEYMEAIPSKAIANEVLDTLHFHKEDLNIKASDPEDMGLSYDYDLYGSRPRELTQQVGFIKDYATALMASEISVKGVDPSEVWNDLDDFREFGNVLDGARNRLNDFSKKSNVATIKETLPIDYDIVYGANDFYREDFYPTLNNELTSVMHATELNIEKDGKPVSKDVYDSYYPQEHDIISVIYSDDKQLETLSEPHSLEQYKLGEASSFYIRNIENNLGEAMESVRTLDEFKNIINNANDFLALDSQLKKDIKIENKYDVQLYSKEFENYAENFATTDLTDRVLEFKPDYYKHGDFTKFDYNHDVNLNQYAVIDVDNKDYCGIVINNGDTMRVFSTRVENVPNLVLHDVNVIAKSEQISNVEMGTLEYNTVNLVTDIPKDGAIIEQSVVTNAVEASISANEYINNVKTKEEREAARETIAKAVTKQNGKYVYKADNDTDKGISPAD